MTGRYVVGALRVRWLLLVVGTLVLALPAAGSARRRPKPAQSQSQEELFTQAVKMNDGFKLGLEAGTVATLGLMQRCPEPEAGHSPQLTADLFKSRGKGVGRVEQDACYTFSSRITFKGSPNLKSAKVAGRFAANRGHVQMAFHATKRATSIPVPKRCTGTPGMKRKGVLQGKFVLKADKLGTERLSSIGATLERPPQIETCSGAGATSLIGYHVGSSRSVYADAFMPNGKRPGYEYVEEGHFGTGFSFEYEVFVLIPHSKYTFSQDLSSGRVKGYRAIKGSATYAGTPMSGGESNGKLSGHLSAMNAAVGKIAPLANGPLTAAQTQ